MKYYLLILISGAVSSILGLLLHPRDLILEFTPNMILGANCTLFFSLCILCFLFSQEWRDALSDEFQPVPSVGGLAKRITILLAIASFISLTVIGSDAFKGVVPGTFASIIIFALRHRIPPIPRDS